MRQYCHQGSMLLTFLPSSGPLQGEPDVALWIRMVAEAPAITDHLTGQQEKEAEEGKEALASPFCKTFYFGISLDLPKSCKEFPFLLMLISQHNHGTFIKIKKLTLVQYY